MDLLGSFRDGEKIQLRKAAFLMTVLSDNTASIWLQHLCGDGEAVNPEVDEEIYRLLSKS